MTAVALSISTVLAPEAALRSVVHVDLGALLLPVLVLTGLLVGG